MKVVLLGTAAGGGFPQWNCACRHCTSGAVPRSQDCLAISADGEGWYLINASPDLRTQILATPDLLPGPGPRETPLRGVLLTDAELDHTLGLFTLRGAVGLPIWAPEAVLHALRDCFPLSPIVDSYAAWTWQPMSSGVALDGLRVTALPVSGKRPKYASLESTVHGPWVVAYRIEDPATGGVLVYAPCLTTWPSGFDEFVAGASYVLLDGTFYSPDEMSGATRAGVAHGAQRAMGHLPISGPDGSLAYLARELPAHRDIRWAYTHLNNTNPLVDNGSPEFAKVRAAGVEVPRDGTHLTFLDGWCRTGASLDSR